MGWAKLDDKRAMNAKLRKVGFAARGLDEAAICQVSSDLSDGHISRETVEMLAAAHGERRWKVLVAKLVEVGRWVENGTGWYIHDYLEFNPTKAAWEAEVDKKREAGRRGGLAKAEADAVARATAPGTANAVAVPSRPVKSKSLKPGTGASHLGTKPETDRPFAAQIADLCQGRNRATVNIEAAAVVAWASKAVDRTIIEEAISWYQTQEQPPALPRAVAAVIASKAADHRINIEPFVSPATKRRI